MYGPRSPCHGRRWNVARLVPGMSVTRPAPPQPGTHLPGGSGPGPDSDSEGPAPALVPGQPEWNFGPGFQRIDRACGLDLYVPQTSCLAASDKESILMKESSSGRLRSAASRRGRRRCLSIRRRSVYDEVLRNFVSPVCIVPSLNRTWFCSNSNKVAWAALGEAGAGAAGSIASILALYPLDTARTILQVF